MKTASSESQKSFAAICADANATPGNGNVQGDLFPKDDIPKAVQDKLEDIEYRQNIDLKGRFANHVVVITYGWMIMVAGCVFETGICAIFGIKFLSDTVLITLLSATSFSVVLGLFCIILRYLFNSKKNN